MLTSPVWCEMSGQIWLNYLKFEPSWYNLTLPVFICFFLGKRFSSISPGSPEGSSQQSQVLGHFRLDGKELYIRECGLSIQNFFLLYKGLNVTRFHQAVWVDDNLRTSIICLGVVSFRVENASDFFLSEHSVALKRLNSMNKWSLINQLSTGHYKE